MPNKSLGQRCYEFVFEHQDLIRAKVETSNYPYVYMETWDELDEASQNSWKKNHLALLYGLRRVVPDIPQFENYEFEEYKHE